LLKHSQISWLEENPSLSPFSKENENYDKIDKTKENNNSLKIN
jgi:hypothetical protein